MTNVTTIKVNLDASQPKAGDILRVIGLGTISKSSIILAEFLQQLDRTVVSIKNCLAFYGKRVSLDMLCMSTSNEQDSCRGDSGGALFSLNDDGSAATLMGNVSWGSWPCAVGDPAVYSRTSAAKRWLQKFLPASCDGFTRTKCKRYFYCKWKRISNRKSRCTKIFARMIGS